MNRYWHSCGQAIDFVHRDNGISYDAIFLKPGTTRELQRCPRCDSMLYPALCNGELAQSPQSITHSRG